MKPDIAISIRVGSGRSDSLPANSAVKRGSTNVSRKIVTVTAMKAMMPG